MSMMGEEYRQPVSEITAERFNDMLEVLPPLGWVFSESGREQSFKLMEMYCGNVTDIFAKSGDRYFQLRDHVTLPHGDIMKQVRGYTDTDTAARGQ